MKKLAVIALALIMILSFAACGSSSPQGAKYDYATSEESSYAESPAMPEPMLEAGENGYADTGSTTSVGEVQSSSRKLIKNVWLSMETLEFDKTVASVQKKVEALGGYIESSNLSGNSYYGSSRRYASITARVPATKLDEFITTAEGLGNITNRNDNVEDVTLTYVDMEARVESLQTEYDRLMELLAEAENLDSIIALEQRLTEVRYEMESYKSQLRTYDNLVDYSTVSMDINEVERITPAEEKGVWERISIEFGENLYNVGEGLVDFFVWLVANIPYLLVWAAVIAIVAFIVSMIIKGFKKAGEKRAERRIKKLRARYEKECEKAAKKGRPAPMMPYELRAQPQPQQPQPQQPQPQQPQQPADPETSESKEEEK